MDLDSTYITTLLTPIMIDIMIDIVDTHYDHVANRSKSCRNSFGIKRSCISAPRTAVNHRKCDRDKNYVHTIVDTSERTML